jgi:uncharacterized membrane protein
VTTILISAAVSALVSAIVSVVMTLFVLNLADDGPQRAD